MSLRRRLRDSGRLSPDVVDVLIAVAVFVTVLLPLLMGGGPGTELRLDVSAVSVVLLTLGCVVLAFRRRALWPAWAASTVIGVAACLEAGGPTPVYVPAVIALATVATRAPTRRTAWAATASALLPMVVIVVVSGRGLIDSFALGMTPWTAAAAMAGIAIRNQRAAVAVALDRALAAEAHQDEEAQRRVAEERLRIARDLHDVVAHHISVINVQSGVAQHVLSSNPVRAAEALGHVREASQTVLDEVPALLGLLRTTEEPEPTAPTPTLEAASALVERVRRSGLDVTMHTTGRPSVLSVGADLAAYRVLQESLTNAARHGTGQAEISVRHDPDGCTVTVRNPRAPTDPSAAEPPRHGLVGMTERVTASGGTMTAGPHGHDWVVDVWLPAEVSSKGGS